MSDDEPLGEEGAYIHERACEACQQVMPLTRRYWATLPGSQYAYQRVCRACVRQQKQKRRVQRAEERAASAFLQSTAVKNGGSNIPHVSELLESICSLFGGVNGVASALALTYYSAAPGGRIRASILESIVRLTTKAAESGATQKPVSLMSDDELEERLAQKLALAAEAQKNIESLRQSDVEIPTGLLDLGNSLSPEELNAAASLRKLTDEQPS